MKKPKKITVKFFVNKTVKPELHDKEKRYPLYMIVTYNRRTNTLKSLYGGFYKDIQQVEKNSPGLLSFEEKVVQKIISYELSRDTENFDIKGIHVKYDMYSKSIEQILSESLKKALWVVVVKIDPKEYSQALNFSNGRVSFETLYAICQKIYPKLDATLSKKLQEEIDVLLNFKKLYPSFFSYTFPTVIDWIDKSVLDDYKNKLLDLHKKEKKKVDKGIATIQKIISSNVHI